MTLQGVSRPRTWQAAGHAAQGKSEEEGEHKVAAESCRHGGGAVPWRSPPRASCCRTLGHFLCQGQPSGPAPHSTVPGAVWTSALVWQSGSGTARSRAVPRTLVRACCHLPARGSMPPTPLAPEHRNSSCAAGGGSRFLWHTHFPTAGTTTWKWRENNDKTRKWRTRCQPPDLQI